jgi:hypothetical protein
VKRDEEVPRYVVPQQPDTPRQPLHPILLAIRNILLLYAAVYVLCYAIEGSLRLKYHVGSVTAIEKRTSDRRLRAKAIVMRQNVIDVMMGDPIYIGYLCVVFFGAPVAMVAVLVHHVRLGNRLLRRIWRPLRWLLIALVIMPFSGITLILGPFVSAQHFYDRTSPAELIARFR